eukprot:c6142_g1_i1.p1 GENE.c6142_g1_i1~~c6142_g1_i1.p1  ORF type:complete len:315 (+),score=70.28 c6142_g1_i1:34-945(+)
MSNPARELLHKITVKDLVQDQGQVITLKNNDSVWKAVKTLEQNGIQSCPVVNANNEFEGFVDVGDLTNFIVACSPDPSTLKDRPLQDLEIAGRAISLVPVSRVLAMFCKESTPIYATDPATHAAQVFQTNTHHVVVFDAEQKIAHVCSQSDVVRYLSTRLPDQMKSIPLSSYGFGVCDVFTVTANTTVLAALQKLALTKVNALPVVDAAGKLVGNFSASDLAGLYTAGVPDFGMGVGDYLAHHSPKSLTPICVNPSHSLHECIKVLSDNGIHHAWSVDEHGVPIGLVSLTDIIKLVMNWVPHN